jgi:hypothetical protein
MKKFFLIVLCIAVFATMALAQNPTYTRGTGITGVDKLGAHQNGGRGCVGCHAPHSGARGNGGSLTWNGTAFVSQAVTDDETGDDVLWGQDLGPLYGKSITTAGGTVVNFGADFAATPSRVATGIMMCLSCHDGNFAKGAMMQNASYEQSAGLLPVGYGGQIIPTLLGNDGTPAGNYANDHPIGPSANLGALGSSIYNYFALDGNKTKVVAAASQPDGAYTQFIANYGSPTILGARTGAGMAVENTMTDMKQAYVVCTTCHTPHTMYTASASTSNPIAGLTAGTFPSYFFVAAPYNPGAPVPNGKAASSATQFCRQCHFKGAGGSNEGSNIMNVPTQF